MSDSFADLWNSTGASKPTEPPRKLGSLAPLAIQQQNARNDVFSMLASTGASSPASRSGTPAAPRSIQATQSLGTGSQNTNMGAKPVQNSVSSSSDAFSGLFPGSLASSSAYDAKMTIAERAAQVERKRQEQLQQQQAAVKQQTTAWAGLDALGEFSQASKPPSRARPATSSKDEWAFEFESTKPSVPLSTAQLPADDWGLEDFVSQPAPSKPANTQPAGSLLDLDEFTSPSYQTSQQSTGSNVFHADTLGDFDFGDRENRLLENQSDNEDDLLGDLGKPVAERKPPSSNSVRPSPPHSVSSGQPSRTVSPPPHILGQIVEMGFSVQQARIALAATDTGLDVQVALETLLSNGAAADSSPPSERPGGEQRGSQREPGWERYYESDEERPPRDTPPRRRQPTTNRDRPAGRSRDPTAHDRASPANETQRNLQEHADKLIAQASEIGLTMFNRANAFWKEGKEKMQRAYEEHAAANLNSSDSGSVNGRPKWMQNVPQGGSRDAEWRDDEPGAFADDHHDDILPPKPSRPAGSVRPKQGNARPPIQDYDSSSSISARAKIGNLLSDDSPAVYTSPFRRKIPARNQVSAAVPAGPSASSSKPSPPPRAPSPVRLVQRKTIPASPAAIAASAKHKAAGTEMFKLGRYAEAETAYSSAIAALPESHLLLIPLHNNRALARIKTGEHNGAIEDCTAVITLIGPSYHPAREAKVTKEEEGAGVDLADALVKAFWRRAEAYEGKEKWDDARKDWEAVAAVEWAGKARMDAVRGIGRCKQMLNADSGTTAPASAAARSRPKATPTSKPRPARPTVVVPTEALNRVREANQAAEAEDQARHELKDIVDTRLTAWKNGKEANIRALIASLDTVLWPGLGWQKVGMHELVTPAQVKIRYTKAIAKLHPDKLNVNNTTLEQRMIANGVFGSLNDAWNAFKQ